MAQMHPFHRNICASSAFPLTIVYLLTMRSSAIHVGFSMVDKRLTLCIVRLANGEMPMLKILAAIGFGSALLLTPVIASAQNTTAAPTGAVSPHTQPAGEGHDSGTMIKKHRVIHHHHHMMMHHKKMMKKPMMEKMDAPAADAPPADAPK
jgi:hypothetical protein